MKRNNKFQFSGKRLSNIRWFYSNFYGVTIAPDKLKSLKCGDSRDALSYMYLLAPRFYQGYMNNLDVSATTHTIGGGV